MIISFVLWIIGICVLDKLDHDTEGFNVIMLFAGAIELMSILGFISSFSGGCA